ncbi:hypothetical protein D3C72_1859230 [compost metagenome]
MSLTFLKWSMSSMAKHSGLPSRRALELASSSSCRVWVWLNRPVRLSRTMRAFRLRARVARVRTVAIRWRGLIGLVRKSSPPSLMASNCLFRSSSADR